MAEYKFTITPMTEMYYNEDSSYGVYKFNTLDKIPNAETFRFDDELFLSTLTGKMQRLTLGLKYNCKAIESYNKKYSKWQYEAIELTIQKPDTFEERKNFLSCILTERQVNSILSVYPNIIDMIVKGEEIDTNKINGVGDKSFSKIKDKILENYVLSDVITLLRPFGITIKMIKKLLDHEKSSVLLKQKLKTNPYILTEIKGLGFKKIDKIALQINPNLRVSEQRTRAFIDYFLKEIGNKKGHSRIGLEELISGVKININDCLNIYNNILEKELKNPLQLHIENKEVGLLKYYNREISIINKLKGLDEAKCDYSITNDIISDACIQFKNERGYDLTEEQKSILTELQNNNVVILTGKAGSGKSSSIDVVLKALNGKNISMCALSAKAVRRMVETTGKEAKTIHRLLGFKGKDFEYGLDNPLYADLIILDEASMVNSSIFLSLLNAISYGCKLLIVFDDGQLPPIGVGNIATDLLKSSFSHVQLNKVHRQAESSGILSDANQIREGINPIAKPSTSMVRGELKDMYYFFRNNKQEIFDTAIMYFMKVSKSIPLEELSICVPIKNNAINCTSTFNDRIQELLLGNENLQVQKGIKTFKLGAKVIQKVNNYEKNVVNGEIGFITNIEKSTFEVTYDKDKIIEYEIKDMDELELAYALTTHSMQGSENHTVIVVLDMNSMILISKELIYTAITRASKRGCVIAEPKAFCLGVKTKANKRNTWLQLLLAS